MKATIEVAAAGGAYEVIVREGVGETRHRVTASAADLARLGPGLEPARVIEAAFRFLLDREPKESILARFEIGVIAKYFPEFERELPRYWTASGP